MNLPLEILDGGGAILGFFYLVWAANYLRRETSRRHLGFSDWFNGLLPPSMHLVVAIFVFDLGVFIRTTVMWVWRMRGAKDFGPIEIGLLGFGGAVVIAGALCKIRAITKPDFGDGPWLAAAGAVALFVIATVWFR